MTALRGLILLIVPFAGLDALIFIMRHPHTDRV